MCPKGHLKKDKANEAETIIMELIEDNFPELKNEVDLQMKKLRGHL